MSGTEKKKDDGGTTTTSDNGPQKPGPIEISLKLDAAPAEPAAKETKTAEEEEGQGTEKSGNPPPSDEKGRASPQSPLSPLAREFVPEFSPPITPQGFGTLSTTTVHETPPPPPPHSRHSSGTSLARPGSNRSSLSASLSSHHTHHLHHRSPHHHHRHSSGIAPNNGGTPSDPMQIEMIREMVTFQVKYHFSDTNLLMDNYLLSKMHENKDHWVPIHTVASLTKIAALTRDVSMVLDAIRQCDKLLELNEDESKCRRINFIPPLPRQQKDLRRTVFLYGLPPHVTEEFVERLCSEYGLIKSISLDRVGPSVSMEPGSEQTESTKTTSGREDGTYVYTSVSIDENANNPNKSEKDKPSSLHINTDDSEMNDIIPKYKAPLPSLRHTDSTNMGPERHVAIVIMGRRFAPRVSMINSPNQLNMNENDLTNNDNLPGTGGPSGGSSSLSTITASSSNNQVVVPQPSLRLLHPLINPNGNPFDFSHLRSCFVVFDSQSMANKCVKHRQRAMDGIRAMHQYDFNKTRKKVAAAKARGISPLFSPLMSTTAGSATATAVTTAAATSSAITLPASLQSPLKGGNGLNVGAVSAPLSTTAATTTTTTATTTASSAIQIPSNMLFTFDSNLQQMPSFDGSSGGGGGGGPLTHARTTKNSYDHGGHHSHGHHHGHGHGHSHHGGHHSHGHHRSTPSRRFPKSTTHHHHGHHRSRGSTGSGGSGGGGTGGNQDFSQHSGGGHHRSPHHHSRNSLSGNPGGSGNNGGGIRDNSGHHHHHHHHRNSPGPRRFSNRAQSARNSGAPPGGGSKRFAFIYNDSQSSSSSSSSNKDKYPQTSRHSGTGRIARGPDGSRGFNWSRNPNAYTSHQASMTMTLPLTSSPLKKHPSTSKASSLSTGGGPSSSGTTVSSSPGGIIPPTTTPQWLHQNLQFLQIQNILMQSPEIATQWISSQMKKASTSTSAPIASATIPASTKKPSSSSTTTTTTTTTAIQESTQEITANLNDSNVVESDQSK